MTANAKNLSTLANVLDDGTNGQFLQSTGSGGIVFADVAAGASVYDSAELLPLSGNDAGDMAYVNSTNRFYINNGTGWYSISLVNTNPNITSVQDASANTTPFTLATDGTATVITITANDPEQIPLTYNYSVTTGSLTNGGGTTATVTQSDNVFTVTPSTTEAYAGTFSLTFTASDGINTATNANSFTLEFITTVTNSNYTTLLATATGTSDNNNITDASSNSHSITVNGDAHAGTFSPYRSGGYSTYFDGSGDWLELTGTALGNGNFTVEAWVWLDSLKDYNVIYDDRASGASAAGLALGVMSTGAPYLYTNNGFQITSSQTCTAKKWHHISLVRSSGVITLYLDGTSGGSYGSSASFTNTNLGIGVARTYTVTSQFDGYIRDVRAVVGTAIAPPSGGPTERLEAVTNTSLLTCHLPYIADGSTNDHSITINGDPETKPFSPYDYLEYSTTDHGGAINFDGTGDYLTIPDHSSLNFASNDWTIECWIYPRTNVSDCGIWHQSADGTDWYSIYLDGAFNLKFVFYNASNGVEWAGTAASNTAPQNTWTHVALVRQFGTGVYLYANGKLVASDTLDASVTMLDKTYDHIIGYQRFVGSGNAFDGLISDFKMDIGTAHYTAEFTPPTAPLSSSGADMHIKGTDASIIDKSQGSNLKLEGGVDNGWGLDKFITSQQAVEFNVNGSNQYLTVAGNSDFDFGSNDFTVEAWVYTDSSSEQVISSGRPSSASWLFLDKQADDTIRILVSTDGSNWAVNSASTETMTLSRWNHISVSRDGSTINVYLDGKLIISTSISGSIHYNTSESIAIGSGQNDSSDRTWNGYISDFRIINGTAVVPPVNGPSEALTEVTNTKLLTCRPSGTSITDLSTTGTTHTITSINSAAAAYASPFGKAMHFDGAGDYINTNSNIHDDIGTAEYTAEAWIYCTSIANRSIFGSGASDAADEFSLFLLSSGHIYHDIGGSQDYVQSSSTITVNTWHHLAVTRTSSRIDIWLDGTSVGSTTNSNITGINVSGNSDFKIGYGRLGYWSGYIQDFRLTNGLARYTASFTPPTASLEG